jgi:hypothetical protein
MTTTEVQAAKPVAVLAGTDLLFSSKVRGAADPLGVDVVSLRQPAALPELLKTAAVFLIDVSSAKIDAIALISQAAKLRSSGEFTGTIVAFGPHVEVERLEKARECGSDAVLTRSQFTEELPGILSAAAGKAPNAPATRPESLLARAERGAGKFTVLVFGLITAAVLYTAYHVLPFYYYYYEIQNQFEQVISVASTESDLEIRRRLWYYIQKYDLPALQEDLLIERDGRTMHIKLSYQEVFSVDWDSKEHILWSFPFTAEAHGEF